MVIPYDVEGYVIPPQIEFTNFTPKKNHQITKGRHFIKDGWGFILNENHWTTLEPTKQLVKNVFFLLLIPNLAFRVGKKVENGMDCRLVECSH